jgi:hypothetical protein
MTRLHIQVNQTIQFYRGQQGGSTPTRLFLSGGASIMPYTAQFFSEKLNLPVEYFNPFRNIQIDPTLNLEELAQVAHSFGEVVGLGLRNLAHCPVELNLMPKSSINRQEFAEKKPYFIAAFFSLVLVVFALGWLYSQIVGIKRTALEEVRTQVNPLRTWGSQLDKSRRELELIKNEADRLTGLVEGRSYWQEVIAELHRVLRQTEVNAKQRLSNEVGANTDVGVWIESFIPSTALRSADGVSRLEEVAPKRVDEYGDPLPEEERVNVTTVQCICRSVDLSRYKTTANTEIAYALQNEFKSSPLFAAEGVELGEIKEVDDSLTFTFKLTLRLNRALTL